MRFTGLEGWGHDVWDIAYYSRDVADWLFAQTRQGTGNDRRAVGTRSCVW